MLISELDAMINPMDKVALTAFLLPLYAPAMDMADVEAVAYSVGITIQLFRRMGLDAVADQLEVICNFD